MKILFTNSPLHFTHGHTFTQPDWQTFILPYLAGVVGEEHEIRLVDNMHYSFWKSNHIMEEIEEFKPDLVGFSIIASRDIFNTMEIIKRVRKKYPNLILIAGGQAATYYYKWLHKIGIDFTVHGEAEITLKELIKSVKEKKPNYSKIKGISYLSKRKIKKTKERPFMKNLDEGPIPRWDLMPKIKSKYFPGRYVGSIEMSRGCSFKCNFCAISAYWKNFRQKSNERILKELKILKKQGKTHLYLVDDNFGMNAEKYIELFKRMIKEKLDMKFFTQIRTDTVANNPEMIEWAAKAGLYGVLVGFDTYDANTFNSVTKVGSIELNIKCSKLLKKNKITIFGSHIYGLPDQKKPTDFLKTFRMGRKYSDLFRMPHFSPLPFTQGYENLVKINPEDLEEIPSEEKHKKDFRPRIGDEKQQKRMERGYMIYTWIHNLSPDEFFKTLFHNVPWTKRLKMYGYIATIRHHFYRYIRKFKLTDI